MSNVTRRNFLAASAVTAGLAGLAGCESSSTTDGEEEVAATTSASGSMEAPSADSYPIEPDAEGVEALWTSEEVRDGWTRVTNPEGGAEIGVMDTARIIQVDGLAFRDMNGDGQLELWEDWRQSADDRAAALAETLTAEECVQLMWHGGATDSSEDATDPDYGALDKGSCAGVSRLTADEDSYASAISWINTVQERCEQRANGIPYINSTDPYSTLGIPSTVGLAACMDKDIWRKAGMWIGRAWRATGVRCELGPQIDLYTNPTVARLSGAETEDPALCRDFTAAFVGGMQSTWGDDEATEDLGWGEDSVACMLKHFVGAGAIEGGRNDHNDGGKFDVFPGGNYDAHVLPFLDGGMNLDSETGQMAAVMPNYGIAYSEDASYGLRVGGGLNPQQLSILRNAGWDGMYCTDWGIISSGRGTEDMTQEERYRMMIDGSIDQYGGSFLADTVGDAVYEEMVSDMGEDEALARVRESARRILKLMANVQLFDQPYADRSIAAEVFSSEAAAEFAQEANDKCVIMLKNDGTISSAGLGDTPKVYIPQVFTAASSGFTGTTPASIDACFDLDVAGEYFDVVTDTVGDPTGDPLEGETDAQYQESDITRLTADDLADVQYALVLIDSPQDAYSGETEDEDGNTVYLPISLQYRPYTADGDSVRQVSIAGNPADGSTWVEHGTDSGVEIENRSHYGQSTYVTNESSLDLVIDTKANLPEGAKLILMINASNPMVFSEIEPYADVILMSWAPGSNAGGGGFSAPVSSLARIITGQVEPSGLLQFQMPADMDTVEAQQEDVPRDMECYVDSAGNTYDFCFGLNWSGVIDDERTATYSVAPITTPEIEIVRTW